MWLLKHLHISNSDFNVVVTGRYTCKIQGCRKKTEGREVGYETPQTGHLHVCSGLVHSHAEVSYLSISQTEKCNEIHLHAEEQFCSVMRNSTLSAMLRAMQTRAKYHSRNDCKRSVMQQRPADMCLKAQ